MKSDKIRILWMTLAGFFLCITQTSCFKILGLFPHAGASHFDFFSPLMRGLAEAGHEVTVVSQFPDKNPPNGYIDLPLTGIKALVNNVDLSIIPSQNPILHYIEFFILYQYGVNACEVALNSSAIQGILKSNEQYDLIIMEQFNADCMTGVAWKLNIPFIALSSCALMPWHYDRFGNPHIPSYIPSLFVGYDDKMTFAERVSNWFAVHVMKLLYSVYTDRTGNELMRKYIGDDVPDIKDLQKRTSLMFVNQHYSLSGPKPLSPQVIELGGIHIKEPKPLDPKIQQILDTADQGVIYVSWGSMIRAESLPMEKRTAILQAFAMLPQRILWKWENESLPNQPSNVFIRKWMPQREILCHPKVRVFMTHGGLLGSSEAAYCGVPTVVTPMYGDQFLNAAAMVNRGFGNIVHYEDITKESIYNALKKALEPSSSENAKAVSYSYRDRPQAPLELGIWWVEHIARTGGAPLLKTNAINLPWYIYYSIDVIGFILAVIILIIISWIWMLRKLFRRKNGGRKSKSE